MGFGLSKGVYHLDERLQRKEARDRHVAHVQPMREDRMQIHRWGLKREAHAAEEHDRDDEHSPRSIPDENIVGISTVV